MLNCKDISKLISESLEKDLPLRTRMAVKFHLMMCSMCRIYYKQTHVLREAVREYGRKHEAPIKKIPADAAEKIKQALADEQKSNH